MSHDHNQIRISAKNLGSLALANFCPRCFWLKLKLKFKLPWQIFPGIFSSIDSYSKKITWSYYEKYGVVPPWFQPFGEFIKPVKVPHYSKYFLFRENENILLTGIPDDIFQKRDGSYFIIDYKAARFTDHQDELLPLYQVQLNGYALIGEQVGFSPVSGLGLCYYEPQTQVNEKTVKSSLIDGGFTMPFKAHLLEVGLDSQGVVLPLLRRVREIGDRQEVPTGRDECEECGRVEEVVGLVRAGLSIG